MSLCSRTFIKNSNGETVGRRKQQAIYIQVTKKNYILSSRLFFTTDVTPIYLNTQSKSRAEYKLDRNGHVR